MSALHYVLMQHVMSADGAFQDVGAFFDRLGSGAGLAANDPILVLRKRLEKNAIEKRRMSDNDAAAIIIKGWNAYREGRAIQLLAWRSGGATPEAFPEIV
jgi:hypothetical protein